MQKKVHTLGVESTHKVFKNLFSVMQNAVHVWMKGPTHRRSCVLKNTRVRVDVALIRVKHIQMEPTVPQTPNSPACDSERLAPKAGSPSAGPADDCGR